MTDSAAFRSACAEYGLSGAGRTSLQPEVLSIEADVPAPAVEAEAVEPEPAVTEPEPGIARYEMAEPEADAQEPVADEPVADVYHEPLESDRPDAGARLRVRRFRRWRAAVVAL